MNEQKNIKLLISRLIEQHPLREQLDLLFEDCVIRIASNSGQLIKKLKAYYKGFKTCDKKADICVNALEITPPDFGASYTIKQPDPGKKKIKEEFYDFEDGRIVRKRLTGMIFLFGGKQNLAVGPCIENDNQVVNFINNRFIEWHLNRSCLLGHAAAINWKSRGLALAGFSGMGKSTLAMHLMCRGADFVSNDRLMIQKNGKNISMYGVPKFPRVNPGTILNNPQLIPIMSNEEREKFSRLSEEALWNLECKYDVFIDKCFGKNKHHLTGRLNGLAILNWKRNDAPLSVSQVNLDERGDLLSAFIKSPGLFYKPAGTGQDFSEDIYLEFLKNCTVFEISGGIDFRRACDACLYFLNTGKVISPGRGNS